MAATAMTPPSRMRGAYTWPLRTIEARPLASPVAMTTIPTTAAANPRRTPVWPSAPFTGGNR
jgi:hypothetical protein